MSEDRPAPARLRALLGLAMVGYGLLVVLGVIAHEARWTGWASLALGAILTLTGLPRLSLQRRGLVLGIGLVCAGGVLGYNLTRGSSLSLPEWGILGYGLLLVVLSPALGRRFGRTDVGTLVAWSFPLVLAPLAMFALNAVLSGGGGTAAGPVVNALVVVPTAFMLQAVGTPVELVGNNMVLATPRGRLVLGVGLVCAGLYPMVLFAGLAGLHAWQRRLPVRRFAGYLAAGLATLWFLNLVRLVALTKIGQAYGAQALQTAHAHLGWILFALFMVVYWSIVLKRERRLEVQDQVLHATRAQ